MLLCHNFWNILSNIWSYVPNGNLSSYVIHRIIRRISAFLSFLRSGVWHCLMKHVSLTSIHQSIIPTSYMNVVQIGAIRHLKNNIFNVLCVPFYSFSRFTSLNILILKEFQSKTNRQQNNNNTQSGSPRDFAVLTK